MVIQDSDRNKTKAKQHSYDCVICFLYMFVESTPGLFQAGIVEEALPTNVEQFEKHTF